MYWSEILLSIRRLCVIFLFQFKEMDRYRRQCIYVAISMIVIVKATSLVNVTFIHNAVAKGAVCLDGSPGAYYLDSGFGDGVNNWLIYLPGGGWCNSESSCLDRSRMNLGSTKNASAKSFGTILSPNQDTNPDFYNWNKVEIVYCDGASFMADVEAVDPESKLHLRGRRIFSSIIEELIATKGMGTASNAILVGTSAGGLATILNCDRFHSYLPNAFRVKCFSDSGFFIRARKLPGVIERENYYANVISFHELAIFLPVSCTSRLAPSLCLFSENVVGDVQTPLFLLHSDCDQYQINNNLKPNPPDWKGWKDCTKDFKATQNCTSNQLQLIKDFQDVFMETVMELTYNPSRGLFINSCFIHDFIYKPSNWQGLPTLQNKTIARAFGDWYFERSKSTELIDNETAMWQSCG